VVQAKLNGLSRIVRHWLRQNGQIANIKLIARPDHHAAQKPAQFLARRRTSCKKNRDLMGFCQSHHPATVISVLVSHQNGVDIRAGNTQTRKSLLCLTPRQTAVNEYERLARVD
jgi:hypothetical protein